MQIEFLGERYQLQDSIGRGGMATIYRGRDMRMDRVVAVKVLREVYSTDPKFVTRFQREAKAASALQHPNIVQVYDYGQSDGNYFIVMELIEGTDLRRYLRSRGVLDIGRAIIIAHDVALGLGAAHRRNIVHRDVKPQNILVGRDASIKLTDFGIASVYKDINDERLTTTGMTLGTVQYYAPEQAQGEIVHPAADVYALGIVMYEMLTGRTPFDGDTPVAVAMQHIQDAPVPPSQLNHEIPPALEDIILRCLEKVPEMRYRDGNSLARALEMLGEEKAAPPPRSSGGLYTPPISGPQNRISQQPAPANPYANGRGPDGRLISSPNNTLGTMPYNYNGSQPNGPQVQQPLSPASFARAGAMTELDHNSLLYPESQEAGMEIGSTRPFQRGTITRDSRDSRFASVITILILLATLLLLGFSIYLASDLGFIPFLKLPGAPTAAPFAPQQLVPVPNLVGMKYQDAKALAESKGFKLVINNGLTDGIVRDQDPTSQDSAASGTSILVNLSSNPPTLRVPDNLAGDTLASVEAKLSVLGIKYNPISDPTDPRDARYKSNTVLRTDPPSGTILKDGQVVTVYVVNLTNGTPVPTAIPGITATAVPTLAPTPTVVPTKAPTPTVVPTKAPTPISTVTPIPTVTPTGP